jgi:hypothetical protein
VLLWVLLFAGCAGVGALIASRANPFPPGVQGGPTATISPTPQAKTWTLRFVSATSHRLFYGGRCRSKWKGSVKVTAAADGSIGGMGRARLVGRLKCGFPNAQIQTKVLDLIIHGTTRGTDLVLAIRAASASPTGSRDYGGFVATVLRRDLRLPVGVRRLHMSARDSTRKGRYSSRTSFTLSCTASCG